jgi:hypothetical protein
VSIFRLPLAEPLFVLILRLPLAELPLLVTIVVEELLLPLDVSVSVPVPPWGLHPANAKAAPRTINSFFIRGQTSIAPKVLQWGEKLPSEGNSPYKWAIALTVKLWVLNSVNHG